MNQKENTKLNNTYEAETLTRRLFGLIQSSDNVTAFSLFFLFSSLSLDDVPRSLAAILSQDFTLFFGHPPGGDTPD